VKLATHTNTFTKAWRRGLWRYSKSSCIAVMVTWVWWQDMTQVTYESPSQINDTLER
jgi:hypothetical protein